MKKILRYSLCYIIAFITTEGFAQTTPDTALSGLSAVASVTDGGTDAAGGTYAELNGARAITTVTIDNKTYALVAAWDDDGVQIIDISTPSSPTAVAAVTDDATDGEGGTFTTLDGARAITTVTISGKTYALVTAQFDKGVQIIDISDPASPKAVAAVTDGDTYPELNGPFGITTATIGNKTYALVAALRDDGVQIIDISTPGSPSAVASVTDGSAYPELDGAQSITTVRIGNSTYALVAAYFDNGVQIIDISTPGSPTAVAAVTDGDTYPEL